MNAGLVQQAVKGKRATGVDAASVRKCIVRRFESMKTVETEIEEGTFMALGMFEQKPAGSKHDADKVNETL